MTFQSEASQNYALLFLIVCFKVALRRGQCTLKDCTNDVRVETTGDIAMEILKNQLDALQQDIQNSLEEHKRLNVLHMSQCQDQTLQVIDSRFQEQELFLKAQNTSLKNQFDALKQNIQNSLEEHKRQNVLRMSQSKDQTLQDIDRRFQEQELYVKAQNTTLKNQFDALKQNIQNSLEEQNRQIQKLFENTTNQIQEIGRRIQELDQHSMDQNKLSNHLMKEVRDFFYRRDCSDIRANGRNQSGVYELYLTSIVTTRVFCDMQSDGTSWLVFQRRVNGSVDFYRTWNEYANGFGDPSGELWLGNEILYLLTSRRKYKLRVELEAFHGSRAFAEYSTFSIGSSGDKYRLTVSGYSGDAGDSLAYSNGRWFSTKDANNDGYNCSVTYSGAWWYNNWHGGCYHSHLNALYVHSYQSQQRNGIIWRDWDLGYPSLKATQMKIALV